MNILVVNAHPSWAPSLKIAQNALGLISVRSQSKTPDEMPLKEVENLKSLAEELKANVVLLDNHWVPHELIPISLTLLRIAVQLRAVGIEVFYLNNGSTPGADETLRQREFGLSLYQGHFCSELWRAFKPVKRDIVFPSTPCGSPRSMENSLSPGRARLSTIHPAMAALKMSNTGYASDTHSGNAIGRRSWER